MKKAAAEPEPDEGDYLMDLGPDSAREYLTDLST